MVKTLELVLQSMVGTGHAQRAWLGFRFPLHSVGSLLWHKSAGLSCSPSTMASCTTLGLFLQDSALAQAVHPALSIRS